MNFENLKNVKHIEFIGIYLFSHVYSRTIYAVKHTIYNCFFFHVLDKYTCEDLLQTYLF